MEHISELSQKDLQNLYIKETDEFLEALKSGATWQTLKDKRERLREISILLDIKVTEGKR